MQNLTEKLARRLSELRKSKSLTLDQLAQSSGVSRAALSRIENSEVSPSADVLAKLGAAYDMSLAQLVAGVDEPSVGVVPRDAQSVMRDQEAGVLQRVVSPGAKGLAAQMVEVKLQPNSVLPFSLQDHAGEEQHVYMLSGHVQVKMGEEVFALGPGDTLRYRCEGDVQHATGKGQGAKYVVTSVAP